MENRMTNRYEGLRDRLLTINDHGRGVKFSVIGVDTGIGRSKISQYAHGHANLKEAEVKVIADYLDALAYASEGMDGEENPLPIRMLYKSDIELYQTTEYRRAFGWCKYIQNERKTGVMIGYPGSGKTTILEQFCKLTPGAVYIDCWETMTLRDVLKTIAYELGLKVTGTKHDITLRIVEHLKGREDIVFVFDETENLRGRDVKSINHIRKIWDHTKTPTILAGTQVLADMLTRGTGRENLAQLYRREYKIELSGIKAEEVNTILHDYNIEPEAANLLMGLALDLKNGGMGNFVEILDMSLKTAAGGVIDAAIVKDAKEHKLLH